MVRKGLIDADIGVVSERALARTRKLEIAE
jgi:hypothetical protein